MKASSVWPGSICHRPGAGHSVPSAIRVTAVQFRRAQRSAQGKDALRRAWPVYRQAIHRHLAARLTAEQCRELAALLGQVIAAAEAGLPVRFGR